MAKQIYIDENGNEVLVSGTITDAGNLPLGTDFTDPTSTAGAIKAHSISGVSATSTSTPISSLDIASCYQSGDVVQLNLTFTLAVATSMDIIAISGVTPKANVNYCVTGPNNELIAGTFYTDGNISIRRVTAQAASRNYEISLVFIKA